ncbi:MAG TPA: hypothetical protein VLT83_03110 [Opitutaceae bacterium]|nr:hypothetical protein [Opitutaceae bacterium]
MKLAAATALVTTALGRMHALYHQVVFDEWVIVSLAPEGGGILAYRGPRAESYRRQFAADVGPLRAEMEGKRLAVGDFEFAPAAAGTRFDVCLRIGETSYLIGNHTGKSMAEIRQDARWLQAQKAFVELSNRFRADPLEN